jgi:hypothetical protein
MGEESYHNKMLELLGKLSGRVLTDMEGGWGNNDSDVGEDRGHKDNKLMDRDLVSYNKWWYVFNSAIHV